MKSFKFPPERKGHRAFSLVRTAAIASITFVGLMRLKIFYALLVFAFLLIGGSAFMARFSFQQEFHLLKDVSLGAMSMFTSLLAIVATARLIPQDIEDRTVYTILAKPLPRFEYVIGKLAGVLLLLAIGMLFLSATFLALLYAREQMVLHETARHMLGAPRDEIDSVLRSIRSSAVNFDIFPVIGLIYVKASVLAALTLCVSTFASTSAFTTMVMVFVYFIGYLQPIAREYWLQSAEIGSLGRIILALVALMFPDLQAFDLVGDVVAGTAIPAAHFLEATGLGIFYVAIYSLLAALIFYGKEL